MRAAHRSIGPVLFVALASGPADAATPKEIGAAVDRGTDFLKQLYRNEPPGKRVGAHHGIGPAALAGLALLENGTPAADPAVKAITAAVRDAAYAETRTYQITLCLLYLDRLGEPADVPLIQVLGVRLLAGQNAAGGWTYECVEPVPAAEEQRLRARLDANQLVAGGGRPNPGSPPVAGGTARPAVAGRLHAEVEKYRQGLLAADRGGRERKDDNSNTQFGILGVWVARRHAVPVEAALDRIEKRFLATQTPTGGWPYGGHGGDGSPSMTCAGLLGLATAVGRRAERELAAKPVRPATPPPPAPRPDPAPKANDPFFNPPPVAAPVAAPAPKRPPPRRAPDERDRAVERGMDNLGDVLIGRAPVGGGKGKGKSGRPFNGRGLGDRDLYFLWSLERVGVIYGREKIGGVDWHQYGADALIPAQNADGSWGGGGGYGPDVDTAFALLFLARSNLVRDLTAKVQNKPVGTELRAVSTAIDPGPPAVVPSPSPGVKSTPGGTIPPLPPVTSPAVPPAPADDESRRLAADLVGSGADAWATVLEKARDDKGAAHTAALVLAIPKLDADRQKQAREALAERLTRMTAETLRTMMTAGDAELRRAAVLAGAMKDDRAHVPDLIDRLADDEEAVVRAARAGLKSLSGGQDFGPAAGATGEDRAIAAAAWRAWWDRQKK